MYDSLFNVETSTRVNKKTGKVSTWKTERLKGTRYTLKSKIKTSNVVNVIKKIEKIDPNAALDIRVGLRRVATTGQAKASEFTLQRLLSFGSRNKIEKFLYNFGYTPEEVAIYLSINTGQVIDTDWVLDESNWNNGDLILPNGQVAIFDFTYGGQCDIIV